MRIRWMLLCLICLSALIYLPFLNNPFIWDDEQFIIKNLYVTTFNLPKIFTTNTTGGAGLVDNYYRPLTSLSLALDWQFWQLNPIGFHITNYLLHTAAALVLLLFLLTIKVPRRWSFFLAILFTVHPVQTESVIYINSRGDSLYTLLLLTGLLFFATLITAKKITWHFYEQTCVISEWWLALLSILFFTAAIFAKEIALAGLGLYGLTWLLLAAAQLTHKTTISKFLQTQRAALATMSVCFFIVVGYLLLRTTTLNFTRTAPPSPIDAAYAASLPIRLLTFSRAVTEYTLILVAPINSHMERTLPLVTNLISPFPWLLVVTSLGIGLLGYLEWKTYRTLWIGFGATWFLMLLVPVSGIVPINGLLYEHWLYLPQVGFFLCLLGILKISRVSSIINRHPAIKPIMIGITISTLVLLSLLQNYRWADPVRLYSYTLQFTESARIHNNLAISLASQGQIAAAILHYQRAIELSDQYPQTFHNLGNAYLELGKTDQAIENYENALALDEGFFHSYQPLLSLYLQTKQKDKALKLLETIKSHTILDPQQESAIQQMVEEIPE